MDDNQLTIDATYPTRLRDAMAMVKQAGYKIGRPLDEDPDPKFSWADDVDDEEEPVRISLTGSIRDAELTDAITDAYAKHGPRLADLIRNL